VIRLSFSGDTEEFTTSVNSSVSPEWKLLLEVGPMATYMSNVAIDEIPPCNSGKSFVKPEFFEMN
jgi:hypothetical protein